MISVAMPDGSQIAFSNKEEADAYIKKFNEQQGAYDADSSAHTEVDKMLDEWAKKVIENKDLWSDPQRRQDWIAELEAMSIPNDDKSFMRLDPTSRFNTTFEALFSQIKHDARKDSEKALSYWKDGEKQPLNNDEFDTRSVASKLMDLSQDGKIPMATILNSHGLFHDTLKWQVSFDYQKDLDALKKMPEMMKRYKEELLKVISNSEESSFSELAPFFEPYGNTPAPLKALGTEMIERYFEAKPDLKKDVISNAPHSQNADYLLAIAGALPSLDGAKYDDSKEQKKNLNDFYLKKWMPSNEDSEAIQKAKEEALTSLSNKGYVGAQQVLATFYLNNGNDSKARVQLSKIQNNPFSSEKEIEEASHYFKNLPQKGNSKLKDTLAKHSRKTPLKRQNTLE